jgi:hypothetical protein
MEPQTMGLGVKFYPKPKTQEDNSRSGEKIPKNISARAESKK